MGLETVMEEVQGWTKQEFVVALATFVEKYERKHLGALHSSITVGTCDKYIERESQVGRRYLRRWKYYRIETSVAPRLEQYEILAHGTVTPPFKPQEWLAEPDVQAIQMDLHHRAQENKLRRHANYDRFP